MLATFNCPLAPTWAISGSGAQLLSADFSGLNDGRPGTLATFRGCTLPANNTVLTATGFSLPYTAGQPYYLVVGIQNVSLAPGSVTTILANGAGAAAGTLTQALVQYPQVLAATPSQTPYIDAWYVLTPAQLAAGGAITSLIVNLTTASASQVFTVGEITFGLAADLPISGLDVLWSDPSKLNRSSGNQPWPVLRKPFRQVSAVISPQTFSTSFGGTSTTNAASEEVLYALSVSPKIAIVPRWRQPGASVVDTDMVQRMAMLARGVNFGAEKSAGAENFYSAPLQFEELL